ncbi:MAG: peptidoglycan bridge formation glycyltransferase FemA/FemB family protein [Mogibacterium sp.]|nr:peptidoglycan bridge formation glycyltransferase FemA/FemB family protein [Mogibacterium sp.]
MRNFEFREDLSREEFNSLALEGRQRVKAHFLGSYEWGEVSSHRGRLPHYVGVYENGKLAATALVLEKSLIAGYTYFYIPRGFTMNYKDLELLRYMTECIAEMGRRRKALYFKIDPDIRLHTVDIDGNEVPGEKNEALVAFLGRLGYRHKPLNYGFENEQPRFTFRIPLDGEPDEIENRYSRTTRTRIRQAHEAGVEVYKGGSEDIREFVRLMTMTEKRQGFFSHEPDYYQYFYDILAASGMVTLYFGKLDVGKIVDGLERDRETVSAALKELEGKTGKKAAGRIKETEKKLVSIDKQLEALAGKPRREVVVSTYLITHYADKAWALYAANDMDYGRYFANYAVYQQQIRDSKDEGREVFDVFGTVGRPEEAGSTAGLYEFKKKWGGELTEFIGEFDYILNKPVYFAYSKLIPLDHDVMNKRFRKKVQKEM